MQKVLIKEHNGTFKMTKKFEKKYNLIDSVE